MRRKVCSVRPIDQSLANSHPKAIINFPGLASSIAALPGIGEGLLHGSSIKALLLGRRADALAECSTDNVLSA
jgi:hypothetical protein